VCHSLNTLCGTLEHTDRTRKGQHVAKIHKTLRIEEELAQRVTDAKQPEETESGVYSRLLTAGLDAIEGHNQEPASAAQEAPQKPAEAAVSSELIKAKDETISVLKKQLEEATERAAKQLADANQRTQEALTVASQAQQLHALATGKKQGFLKRLFGKTDNQQVYEVVEEKEG
jgi:small-conductance mechanosensitive channel